MRPLSKESWDPKALPKALKAGIATGSKIREKQLKDALAVDFAKKVKK